MLKFQEYFHKNENKIKYNITDSFNERSDHPYKSILELHEVNYYYVRSYHCVKKIKELKNHNIIYVNSKKIYLFVEGKMKKKNRL